ncbi:hypothetical protein STCU_02267 [Strigomonas culicis]|uniref:Uncharacterized protein n=1 Tax=Strigomonas culicis TaxID=28005 RepID=S9W1G0_9TRYP|nr:hypothetical protein STCU_02267 [Strigomonas culicis]|eukprot:EPY33361.1 hypothetical protein STCU_02267 [Strigomonas culicis]
MFEDRREHYLDLNADDDPTFAGGKRRCFVTRDEIIRSVSDDASSKEHVVSVEVYEEPENTALGGWFAQPHYYVVFQTRNWWWSVELRGGMVILQRAKCYNSVQNRCLGRYRNYKWFVEAGPVRCSLQQCSGKTTSIRDVIDALLDEGLFEPSEPKISSADVVHVVGELFPLR